MWLLPSDQRDAVPIISKTLAEQFGPHERMNGEEVEELARCVAEELSRQGWLAKPSDLYVRLLDEDEVRAVFTEAVMQTLDWDAFKSWTDDEIAEALIKAILDPLNRDFIDAPEVISLDIQIKAHKDG